MFRALRGRLQGILRGLLARSVRQSSHPCRSSHRVSRISSSARNQTSSTCALFTDTREVPVTKGIWTYLYRSGGSYVPQRYLQRRWKFAYIEPHVMLLVAPGIFSMERWFCSIIPSSIAWSIKETSPAEILACIAGPRSYHLYSPSTSPRPFCLAPQGIISNLRSCCFYFSWHSQQSILFQRLFEIDSRSQRRVQWMKIRNGFARTQI